MEALGERNQLPGSRELELKASGFFPGIPPEAIDLGMIWSFCWVQRLTRKAISPFPFLNGNTNRRGSILGG